MSKANFTTVIDKEGNKHTLKMHYVGKDGYHYVEIAKKDLVQVLPAVMDKIKKNCSGFRKPDFLTWHWTAGAYDHPYASYQVNVGEDYILINLYALQYVNFHHTYHRNSIARGHGYDNFGMTFMAMGGNRVNGMYDYDIRKKPGMIETGAIAQAIIMESLGLSRKQITDHDAWSKIDDYDSYRWDNQLKLEDGKTLFKTVLEKALWYQQKWAGKKRKPKEVSDLEKHKNIQKVAPVSKNDTDFSDVNSSQWFADAVHAVTEEEILVGRKTSGGGNMFAPKENITRAEIAVVAHKLMKRMDKLIDGLRAECK